MVSRILTLLATAPLLCLPAGCEKPDSLDSIASRGTEAVTYVQNIRHYYSILKWQDIPDNTPAPPLQSARFIPEVIRTSRLSAL